MRRGEPEHVGLAREERMPMVNDRFTLESPEDVKRTGSCVIAQILVRFARPLPRSGGDHDFNPAVLVRPPAVVLLAMGLLSPQSSARRFDVDSR